MRESSVDLPQPLGPTMARNFPASREKVMSDRAWVSPVCLMVGEAYMGKLQQWVHGNASFLCLRSAVPAPPPRQRCRGRRG